MTPQPALESISADVCRLSPGKLLRVLEKFINFLLDKILESGLLHQGLPSISRLLRAKPMVGWHSLELAWLLPHTLEKTFSSTFLAICSDGRTDWVQVTLASGMGSEDDTFTVSTHLGGRSASGKRRPLEAGDTVLGYDLRYFVYGNVCHKRDPCRPSPLPVISELVRKGAGEQ